MFLLQSNDCLVVKAISRNKTNSISFVFQTTVKQDQSVSVLVKTEISVVM